MLFLQDSYIKEFDSVITEIIDNKVFPIIEGDYATKSSDNLEIRELFKAEEKTYKIIDIAPTI